MTQKIPTARRLAASLAFILPLLSTTGVTPAAAASRCAEAVGDCEYYQCIEEQVLACGEQGYALGYVKPYCEKFVAADFPEVDSPWSETLFPDDANAWRDGVLVCLQNTMESFLAENDAPTCKDLQDVGFASHPTCYTANPSFCAITPQNALRVGLIIGPSLLRQPFLEQVRTSARICVEQLDARIAREDRRWVRQQLGAYKVLWQAVALDPRRIAGTPRQP